MSYLHSIGHFDLSRAAEFCGVYPSPDDQQIFSQSLSSYFSALILLVECQEEIQPVKIE